MKKNIICSSKTKGFCMYTKA